MNEHPTPPFPKQQQPMPGLTAPMQPVPDHGEVSYHGSGPLAGKKADEATFRAAAEAALQNAKPQKDNAFKIELAKRTLARALATAAEKKV